MRNAVITGTCEPFDELSDNGIEVYAKTGTAQRSKKSLKEGDIGWVTGFAIDTKKRKDDIVFTAVFEYQSSKTAVLEMKEFIKNYYK